MFGFKKVKKFKCVGKVMKINLKESSLQLFVGKIGNGGGEAVLKLTSEDLDGKRLLHTLALLYYDSPHKREIIKSQVGKLEFGVRTGPGWSTWSADLNGPAVEIKFFDII
ncbi:hypothetical protein HYX00_02485 [Candidatus Woesearchaeota archaeon]|nr:hypothetical protein [Candidatus Woesearchaeota archaeon]